MTDTLSLSHAQEYIFLLYYAVSSDPCSHTIYFHVHTLCISMLIHHVSSCSLTIHTVDLLIHVRIVTTPCIVAVTKDIISGSWRNKCLSRSKMGQGPVIIYGPGGGGGLSSNSFVQEFFFSLKNFKDPISSSHTWDELW